MPQSPKTTSFMQTTPTIKSEMDAKQCISANSTNNNNTIFNFPIVQSSSSSSGANINTNTMATSKVTVNNQINQMNNKHQHKIDDGTVRISSHEGKNLDINDLSCVNVNVASLNHLSTSCCPNSSSKPSNVTTTTYNNALINTQSTSSSSFSSLSYNKINVSACDDDGGNLNAINPHNGIIIAETHETEGASYYDAIKLEENGTTAIIYETIVIENPATTNSHPQDIQLTSTSASNPNFMNTKNNNNNHECSKFLTNKNHTLMESNNCGGGIIVLTGSLNDLLLNSQNGAGQCLNDVVKSQIQSIVLNLNSQSSAPTVNTTTTLSSGNIGYSNNQNQQQHHQQQQQQSILVAINSNHQVKLTHIKLSQFC